MIQMFYPVFPSTPGSILAYIPSVFLPLFYVPVFYVFKPYWDNVK